jgi:hypothetical protein
MVVVALIFIMPVDATRALPADLDPARPRLSWRSVPALRAIRQVTDPKG